MSQNLYLGPTFLFYVKRQKSFCHSLELNFLDFIK